MSNNSKTLFLFLAILYFSSVSAIAENEDPGLVMNYYRDSALRLKISSKNKFSFFTSATRTLPFLGSETSSMTASLKEGNGQELWMRNFRYIETIKEALERECPGVVSCSDILVLSARDGIVALGGPYIPLKTGRRDGRKSRADILEQHLPDHNESMSVVLERFANIGINTPGVVALLGSHSVGRTHCVKLVHRLYPEVDPALNPAHVEHMLYKCPDAIPDPKAVQYVRNDRGTPMKLDNNYYRNILDNKGLLIVDHQLATDKRTKPFVKKMAKNQDYFFKEFARAITILSENNPLTGTKGEIRKQCNLANKLH
ncbi:Peroxidase 42 [Sesamum angolense]|uniref:Peroxidase n=1 Tax=Sesamum angolense TaxID=2727404 RepID=A0AAE1WSN8_9LAMI|nr:Peroxidase 42 [Sesamum angolense]